MDEWNKFNANYIVLFIIPNFLGGIWRVSKMNFNFIRGLSLERGARGSFILHSASGFLGNSLIQSSMVNFLRNQLQ